LRLTEDQVKQQLARQAYRCRRLGIPGQVEFWESIYGESYDAYVDEMIKAKKK